MSEYQFNEVESGLPSGLVALTAGTYTRNGAKLVATGANPGGAGWVFYEDLGTPNVVLVNNVGHGTSTSSAPGATFRIVDEDNMWAAVINTSGVLGVYKRVAGSWGTPLYTYAIPSFVLGNAYSIVVTTDDDDIVIDLNAALAVISFNDPTFNTATKHGGRFGDAGQESGRVEITALSTPFLSVDQGDYHSRQVFGGLRTVTFTGQHGNQSGAIHYKLDGGSAVVGVASPTGSAWNIDITLAEGNHSVEFFFADNLSLTKTVSNVIVNDIFHIDGQSNGSGFGGNNQTFIPNGNNVASFLGNDDIFRLAIDPFDSNVNQVRAISSYANAGGSWAIHFANAYVAGENKSLCMVPNSVGSVGIDRLLKTDSNRIDGLNLWEARAERIALTGGCKYVILVGGETNIAAGITKTVFKGWLNQYVDDNFTDFGVKTVIVPFQTITKTGYDGNGTTTGQVPLREAQVEVGSENANAILVDPTTDIVLLTTGDEDGLHYITDAQKLTIGERTYQRVAEYENAAAVPATTSNAVFTLSDASNLTDVAVSIWSIPSRTYLTSQLVTFNGGGSSESIALDVAPGTELIMTGSTYNGSNTSTAVALAITSTSVAPS
jgi:hypothetical protein